MYTTHPLKLICLAAAGALLLGATAQAQAPGPSVTVDADGTVHVPPMSVPQSEFLSEAGQAYVTQHLLDMQAMSAPPQGDGIPAFLKKYMARQQALYPVALEDTEIGGVHTVVYTPENGVTPDNEDRVLINLHGGGFMGCWEACSTLESIPVAALGGIKVVAVDYRQGPDHVFPAASEDVASVYRELLKTYKSENIGIYGCSAGGMLTGEALAWFQDHDLPMPGAAGIFCAGLTVSSSGFGGDAGYFTLPIGELRMPPSGPAQSNQTGIPYFKGADVGGPLISVANHPDYLTNFPPTLIITGTRDFGLSSAIYTHTQLVKEGVEADLHVWEGMFHGFFYNPDVPESQEAYDLMVRFFDRHLGDD